MQRVGWLEMVVQTNACVVRVERGLFGVAHYRRRFFRTAELSVAILCLCRDIFGEGLFKARAQGPADLYLVQAG